MIKQNLLNLSNAYCLVALSFFLTSCANVREEPIRIGVTPFSGYSFLYFAEEKGFFREGGSLIELVDLGSLADVRRAYERGQIDVMTSTLIEHLAVRMISNKKAQSFFVVDYSMGADKLLARQEYRSISDLKNKKIAYEPESIDLVMIHHALASANLRFEDIQAVPMPQTQSVREFLAGNLDAVETYPPFSTEILSQYPAVSLFDSSKQPFAVADVLVADRDFILKNTKRLAALIRAFEKAKQYAQDHPEEARRFISKQMGISLADYDNAFSGLEFIEPKQQLSILAPQGDIEKRTREAEKILKSHMAHTQSLDADSIVTDIVLKELDLL